MHLHVLKFVLHRALVPERRMVPHSIVPHFDVFDQGRHGCVPRLPIGVVHQLRLERREEALGDGIIPTRARFADALAHLVCGEQVTVG